MLKICSAAVIAVIMSAILKRRESVLSSYIGEIAAVTITFSVVSSLMPLVNFVKNISSTGNENRFINTILTAFSVALICQTVSNICKSHAENSLASAVEFAGNAEILLLSLPYISEILKLIFGGLGI